MGGRVPQVLGRLTRSPGCISGKNEQSYNQERKTPMCPFCIANAVALAASATSSGGAAAFVVSKFLRRKRENQTQEAQNETRRNGIGTRSRLGNPSAMWRNKHAWADS